MCIGRRDQSHPSQLLQPPLRSQSRHSERRHPEHWWAECACKCRLCKEASRGSDRRGRDPKQGGPHRQVSTPLVLIIVLIIVLNALFDAHDRESLASLAGGTRQSRTLSLHPL